MWENNKYVDWFRDKFAEQKKVDFPYNNINAAGYGSVPGSNIGQNSGQAGNEAVNPNDMGGAGVLDPAAEDNNVGPWAPNEPPSPSGGSITDFNMDDPESVKALQRKLGVKADGMFGPKTEQAYRMAVDQERQNMGKESYEYDYNEQVADDRKFKPFGGLFRNAYRNLDKNVFKGKLPGGQSDRNIMTAEEYYNK